MSDFAEEKRRLRSRMRDLRAALDSARRAAAAQAMTAHLARVAPWRQAACVGGYWPMGPEIDIRPALEIVAAAGCACALPAVVGRDRPLVFRAWAPGDGLEPGGFGTSVPPASRAAVAPDLLLVPLLAFDARGFRLGYGGGYYDRTIAALRAAGRPVRAVGIAFASQEVETVPVESFDQPLDAVATEDGYRGFGRCP